MPMLGRFNKQCLVLYSFLVFYKRTISYCHHFYNLKRSTIRTGAAGERSQGSLPKSWWWRRQLVDVHFRKFVFRRLLSLRRCGFVCCGLRPVMSVYRPVRGRFLLFRGFHFGLWFGEDRVAG